MDPLTHLLTTRLLIGREPATLLADLAPDLAFQSTYPLWALRSNRFCAVLDGEAGHNLSVALGAVMLFRLSRGCWPWRLLGAYLLHLLIDIPTHTRASQGLRPL